jgi:uncharacterized protein (DUF736 family)
VPIAGTFAATADGGWEGHIRTLTINCKIRLVPNDDRSTERSPDFRAFAGKSEVGAAWRKNTRAEGQGTRLSVKLVDPAFPAGLALTLFERDGAGRADLVWQYSKHEETFE